MPTQDESSVIAVAKNARQTLAEFLRRNRQRAIVEWEYAVRALPAAALLDREAVRDHMPSLIDRLLELVEVPQAIETGDIPARHAIERMCEGFNLEEVAWEYSALRSTLLRLNDEEGATLAPGAIVLLNDAIDQAVVRAISRYHRERVRTLEALDRIAREGLRASPSAALHALLHRLLGVIRDSVEPVDTAVIYLREWDRLVVRAAVGLEEDIVDRFSLAMGEGFAGTVAQTKRSLITHSAETDPLVQNPVLRLKGVKALYGVPLVYGDEVIGVAKMGSNTTTDFTAEQRLILRSTAERAAAFIAQKRVLEDRELFLHVLGHDLRSPLNTIVVGTQSIARHETLSPQAADRVRRVLAAADRMDRLIGDMTDFTQTRVTGHLPLNREKVDLGELLEQIARETQARSERQLQVQRIGDATGEWDRGRLLRVVANLINNALAYGDPSAPVTLSTESEDGWVVLRVHNEGVPIPADLQPHVFDAFKRGSTGVGSGLGLFIVRQVAYAHGGRVEVDSASGRGTTFVVRLPRTPSAEAGAAPMRT